jgi:hypothetical protein
MTRQSLLVTESLCFVNLVWYPQDDLFRNEIRLCLDSFNLPRKHNTDGMLNCLRQPGQLHHDTKTIRVREHHHLLNNIYRD